MNDECTHDDTVWIDDTLRCVHCDYVVALTCLACGGEGFVEENEYENDWINFDNELITCPECRGKGWVTERAWQ